MSLPTIALLLTVCSAITLMYYAVNKLSES